MVLHILCATIERHRRHSTSGAARCVFIPVIIVVCGKLAEMVCYRFAGKQNTTVHRPKSCIVKSMIGCARGETGARGPEGVSSLRSALGWLATSIARTVVGAP
jgi:hypothetical protein